MADDKTKKDGRDGNRVAANERYEIECFAKSNGVTRRQAMDLIHKYGNDRLTLAREAKKLHGRRATIRA
jgi:hypothetical protein